MVKISGKNLGGLVYTLKLVFVLPDYNELRLGRAQLIKMVHTVMKALLLRRWVIDYKKYLQGDAMDVAYDFINDSRTKMAVPSVERVD